MKALIVPGLTDLNKGDQALVWESVRLIDDTNLFDSVDILGAGDTGEERFRMTGQSSERGYDIVEGVLKHPRRGRHLISRNPLLVIVYLGFMVLNSCLDFFKTLFLLWSSRFPFFRYLVPKDDLMKFDVIRSYDVIVVKGGGFLHSYGEVRDIYVFWYLLFYINVARVFGKKLIVLPNSFGPFESFGVKRQLKKAFQNKFLILAREKKSSLALSSILDKQIPVYPDLGFFLKEDSQFNAQEVLRNIGVDSSKRKVGITVRPWRFPEAADPQASAESYVSSIVSFVEYLVAQGNQVIFFNQSLGPNTNEDDRIAIKNIVDKFSYREGIFWLDSDYPCDCLKSIYSELDFLLGTRFHSVIFSLASNVPCGAISYGGNKGGGIMSDIGIDDMVCPITEVTFERLIGMYCHYMSNQSSIKFKISQYLECTLYERKKMLSLISSYVST